MTQTTLDGTASPFDVLAGQNIQAETGDQIILLGTIDNAGEIVLDGMGTSITGTLAQASIASLILDSPTVVLTGTGTLDLNQFFFAIGYGAAPGGETLINASNTIIGAGIIGASSSPDSFSDGGTAYPIAFVNQAGGVVDGTGTAVSAPPGTYPQPDLLEIDTGTIVVVNAGLMEATGPGGLEVFSATLDNTGGTILATGSGNAAGVDAVSVFGGTLEAANGGSLGLSGYDLYDPVAGTYAYVDETLTNVLLEAVSGGTIMISTATLDGAGGAVSIAAGTTIQDPFGGIALTGTIQDSGLFANIGSLELSGAIDNLGIIALGSNGNGYIYGSLYAGEPSDYVLTSPDVTLTGGLLTLAGNSVLAGVSGDALLLQGATIAGSGAIGLPPYDGVTTTTLVIGAGAAVLANGGSGNAITIYDGDVTIASTGALEAVNQSTLALSGTAFEDLGGTIAAIGMASTVEFSYVSIGGGILSASDGGVLDFAGVSTLGDGAVLALDGASMVDVVGYVQPATLAIGGTLTFTAGTFALDYAVLSAAGTGPAVFDIAGGTLTGGEAAIDSTVSLVVGAGQTVDFGGLTLQGQVTNDGTIEETGGGAATIQGGGSGPSLFEQSGGGVLDAGNGVISTGNVDITGGLIAGSDAGALILGDGTTLGGGGTVLSIAAGATLNAFYFVESPPFYLPYGASVTLEGTIDSAGTLSGATDEYAGGVITNTGLYQGTGAILGDYIANDGTLLATGGTLFAKGAVAGSGSIAIAPAATFELAGRTAETIDFRNAGGGTLQLDTGTIAPAAFTGTLANIAVGDVIDLPGQSIAALSTAANTLAVTLKSGGTLDYNLGAVAPGAVFELAAPAHYYTFTYTASPAGDGSYGFTATGWFATTADTGTAGLTDVTAFGVQWSQMAEEDGEYNADYAAGLPVLTSFSATFGDGGAITALSLTTGDIASDSDLSSAQDLTISNLGANGAQTAHQGALLSQGSVSAAADGIQYSEIVVQSVPCFCPGTRIAIPGGETLVEALQIDDEVRTLYGTARVKWIGRRSYDGRFIAGNPLALPVTVRADALAPGVPARNLMLSPGHALFVDGHLLPAWRLVNGVSITQAVAVAQVSYLHVELDRHDIIFAENCPAESYLDDDDRAQFHNAADYHALYPGDAPALPLQPRTESGLALEAIRGRIAARAGVAPAQGSGPVRGYIDIAGPQNCAGWAQFVEAPEVPVALDVWSGGRRIGRVLANAYRADLRQAGLGSGCHAFALDLPGHTGVADIRVAATGERLVPTEDALQRKLM
jgi:hypothetical protein